MIELLQRWALTGLEPRSSFDYVLIPGRVSGSSEGDALHQHADLDGGHLRRHEQLRQEQDEGETAGALLAFLWAQMSVSLNKTSRPWLWGSWYLATASHPVNLQLKEGFNGQVKESVCRWRWGRLTSSLSDFARQWLHYLGKYPVTTLWHDLYALRANSNEKFFYLE